MTIRGAFIPKASYPYFEEIPVQFDWFGGFAVSQKRRCTTAMHLTIVENYPDMKPLNKLGLLDQVKEFSSFCKLFRVDLSDTNFAAEGAYEDVQLLDKYSQLGVTMLRETIVQNFTTEEIQEHYEQYQGCVTVSNKPSTDFEMPTAYKCLFRFEDFFEPTEEIDRLDINTAILKHVRGEMPAFYSYGKYLIPCMLKYYHYPAEGEEVTLHIHKNVPCSEAIDISNFETYAAAKQYFNSPLFPEEYPSIQDGEVLAESRLTDGKSLLFGYTVYFLFLLTVLRCPDLDSINQYIVESGRAMYRFGKELEVYKVTDITAQDIQTVKDLLILYYSFDNYRVSTEDIVEMPVWATTFEAEKFRNVLLLKILSSMNN